MLQDLKLKRCHERTSPGTFLQEVLTGTAMVNVTGMPNTVSLRGSR